MDWKRSGTKYIKCYELIDFVNREEKYSQISQKRADFFAKESENQIVRDKNICKIMTRIWGLDRSNPTKNRLIKVDWKKLSNYNCTRRTKEGKMLCSLMK